MEIRLSHNILCQITECLGTLRSQLHQKDLILKPVKYFSMLIHVTAILDTTGISEEFQEAGNYKMWHIVCASAAVGLCCPFIIVCMFWCLRRYHGEQFYHLTSAYCAFDSAPFHSFMTVAFKALCKSPDNYRNWLLRRPCWVCQLGDWIFKNLICPMYCSLPETEG